MTWQDAKREAVKYAAFIRQRLDERPNDDCKSVKLADFENEDTYVFLKGKGRDVWTLDYHRMILDAVRRSPDLKGVKIEIKVLKLAEYWAWLEKLKLNDAPEHRVAFISFL